MPAGVGHRYRARTPDDGGGRGALPDSLQRLLLAAPREPHVVHPVGGGYRPHDFRHQCDAASEARDALLEAHAEHPRLRRHVLKRLSQQALARGDRERARRWFRELIDLPRADQYIVYASDYLTFGDLLRDLGAQDEAREIYRRGAEIYLRNAPLRERLAALGETVETPPPSIPPVDEAAAGVRRIPVRTPYINARTDMVALIEEATRDVREPGDVVVLAESPAANGQGRVVSLELVEPSPLAERLCRYVGAIGPLHSPEGMEGAIMVAGRILFGERLTPLRVAGILLVTAGVAVVGAGA